MKLPDYRLKQKILYVDRADPKNLINYGELFFSEGNFSDALDFYSKAKHPEGMQKIKEVAWESGDVMLYQRAARALNMEVSAADWEGIAQKAIALKKILFARHALKAANNEKALAELQKRMEAEGLEKSK